MTFSEKVKNELASIENKKECCWKAQAYGMLLFGKNCSEEGHFIAYCEQKNC